MDSADDLHLPLRDTPVHSNLPSRIGRHNTVQHTLPKELIHRHANMLHKARHSDWIARMSLVARSYLTLPILIPGPADADVRNGPATEWCESNRIAEFAIAASTDVWQRKTDATIAVDEEDGKLQHGALDVASKVHLVGRGPSPLWDNSSVGCPTTIV